ncbi:MAG: helix-turn-helix transcriptional regulator [Actinobacteria bacterium]|nr:helix-turn-helix transcriptional regulator [Actinomycetota bacterium]
MSKRYDQYCPIAHALGTVGERWTLLVVRDLLNGPKRYTDLAASLPGIGTNILAARLKELEANGLVEKRKLPPPAASTVYELTSYGRDLRPVLHELSRWGARSLGPPSPDALEEGWLVGALDLALSPLAVPGKLAFRVGAEEASLVDGLPVEGIVEDADVLVESDAISFYHLVVNRQLDGVRVEGDDSLLLRLLDAFAPTAVPLPA